MKEKLCIIKQNGLLMEWNTGILLDWNKHTPPLARIWLWNLFLRLRLYEKVSILCSYIFFLTNKSTSSRRLLCIKRVSVINQTLQLRWNKYKLRAEYALEQIGLLYAVVRKTHEKELSYTQRALLRERLSYLIMLAFEKWYLSLDTGSQKLSALRKSRCDRRYCCFIFSIV